MSTVIYNVKVTILICSTNSKIVQILDEIKIDATDRPNEGIIVSESIWGMLRGLESFSQLVYTSQNGVAVNFQFDILLFLDFKDLFICLVPNQFDDGDGFP